MASTGRVKNGFDLSSDPTVDNNIETNITIGLKPEMRDRDQETDFNQSLHNHLQEYQASQMHDLPRLATQQTQSQGNQTSQHQSLPTYQQQWSQQGWFLTVLDASGNFLSTHNPQEVMSYGYVGTGGPIQDQPQPTQQLASDGIYSCPGNTYLIYDGEGGRVHHPPHLSQGGYSTVIIPSQNPQPTPGPSPMIRPPQFVRNHPYNELIDQLANMGYRVEHVVGAIQSLEERGQPVDFNAVLDRMNGRSSGSPHSGWSG
ncbi:hypothetical protein Leryth_005042 [Lithospermum erythrorhizon]|nr:hypothetical protein Leryth_005042 [Lithospermum erythrorhizon]